MGSIREIIAYGGESFTIEWFYDKNGESEALYYYRKLPEERRRRLLVLLKRMGDSGKIYDETKFRNEGEKIYAFKPQPDRFLCFFFAGRKIILTNAFEKKTQKLPRREKDRALRCKENYEQRVRKGVYYENI
ncbi:MAG: type II toxin-antitoxin system RelE/ParE family toxin [Phycisphaerae bacterium]